MGAYKYLINKVTDMIYNDNIKEVG